MANQRRISHTQAAFLIATGITGMNVAQTKAGPCSERVFATGEASHYADTLVGHLMKNEEPFSQDRMIVAHPTLPMGTRLNIEDLTTGQIVAVTVTDRGPAKNLNRVADLSKRVVRALGRDLLDGTYNVNVYVCN